MAASSITGDLLRADNYKIWSVLMKNYLIGQGLWDVVEGKEYSSTGDSPKEDDEAKWKIKNAQALHTIQICCGPEIFPQIMRNKSAKAAWNKLALTYGAELKANLDIEQGMADSSFLQYMLLHKFVEKGEWHNAKKFMDANPESIFSTSSSGKTVLHIATTSGKVEIVRDLVKRMPTGLLEVRDMEGSTALALAAAFTRNTEMAKCMVEKHPLLLSIKNKEKLIPLLLAAKQGHRAMTLCLYERTCHCRDSTPVVGEVMNEDNGRNVASLLTFCISSRLFDVAWKLLQDNSHLPLELHFKDFRTFSELAQQPSAFWSGSQLTFLQRWIYRRIHHDSEGNIIDIKFDLDQDEQGNESNEGQRKPLFFEVYCALLQVPGIKPIYEQKSRHFHVHEILKFMSSRVLGFTQTELREASVYEALLESAKNGIVEIIDVMTKANPDLFWVVDENYRGIFSHAILYRQVDVFKLIHDFGGRKEMFTSRVDAFENNFLHLAGMLPLASEFSRKYGGALQIQRELQWFEAVKSIVQPKFREARNADGKKPREVFVQNHEELVKEGEKWAKDTATSFSIVGTLLITMMFAAAFTVPGGNTQDTGIPIFLGKNRFTLFIIADAISLFASTTAVLMFIGILTSRYSDKDFLTSLPNKLMIGLLSLFFAVLAMLISFCSSLSVMALRGFLWLVILAIVLALLTVLALLASLLTLFIKIFNSTYRSKLLFDKRMKLRNWITLGFLPLCEFCGNKLVGKRGKIKARVV